MDKYLLMEKDVDQNLNIEGVELSDGSLVSPTYLLRLAKQSGIMQAQLAKAEPLIRADVYREIGEWLETSKHPRRVSDYEIYLLKQGIKP